VYALVEALTALISLIQDRKYTSYVIAVLFGGKLIALNKKCVQPVAIG
jgi:hypothetical protein